MKKVVVFVDDSATVLMSAEVATQDLVDKGIIDIKLFNNPLDVLEQIESGLRYDLLITDINMPQMNGLDMAKELKSIDSVKIKPILALTTENATEKKQTAKQIGLTGWITKPFSPDKLIMGVKRVLRIR
jgi:two-component system chemotaxis response regulator CheY